MMCGIVGYVGKQNAVQIGLEGLKRLEYRGYDSAGVVFREGDGAMRAVKRVGAVANLASAVPEGASSTVAICHTRWATHGGVTEANAHPHRDCSGRTWVIHNGIIENYKELTQSLRSEGHVFTSETDTEVLAHLIEAARAEAARRGETLPLEHAVRKALAQVTGAYGLLVVDAGEPEKIVAARNFSPLIVGVGEGEMFVASDAAAFLPYTKNVVYLDDGDMAVITPSSHTIYDITHRVRVPDVSTLDWSVEAAEKGGYQHFMLKEIMEQPEALRNALRGRMQIEEGLPKMGGLANMGNTLGAMERLHVVACGTSYYSARIGEYMIEEYAGVPVDADIASEFRYRKPVFRKGDVVLAISQSGETVDTLGALREAKAKGVPTLGIVNTVGSTIARETDAGVYEHIGPEIGVASTKAFLAQVGILALLTVFLGRARDMSLITGRRILRELDRIPSLVARILERRKRVTDIAAACGGFKNFLFLGRKYNYPVAAEGALKLKEIAYVHAEGIPAGETKHGPLALVDAAFPSIVIAPQDSVYEKMLSTIQEIKARGGPVIAVATEGDDAIARIADHVMYIPKTLEMLTPLLSVIPLQLFAYESAVLRGRDVDKPRNLAKSVTVE